MNVNDCKVILASASPRRQELLKQIQVHFITAQKSVSEEVPPNMKPIDTVLELAQRKAVAVADEYPEKIVIGADTIVVKDATILGKPKDYEDAVRTLQYLSGSQHQVITGFCLMKQSTGQVIRDYEITEVFFRDLSLGEIKSYVNTGEPMDKAGSYGIQGVGALLVEKIEGCYFNVVGLPLLKVATALKAFGYHVLGEKSLDGDS